MKIKKFNNNKLYKYSDLCYALDKEVELLQKCIADIKKYYAKNPLKGYSGHKLNELNWNVEIGGYLSCLSKRNGTERAKLMRQTFVEDIQTISEIQSGLRYPWKKS